MISSLRILSVLLLLSFSTGIVSAQDVPFLSEEEYNWIVNEVSGNAAYEHIRYFTQFHRPSGGAPGLMEVARYVHDKSRDYGLEDVRLIRQKSSSTPWENEIGEIWLVQPQPRKIASTVWHPLYLSDYSRTTKIDEAPIVFVGSGSREEDYADVNVSGAVVLAWGNPRRVMDLAVWQRGALGLITYPDPSKPDYPENSLNRPDSLRWSRVPVEGPDGKKGTFGFRLSVRQGLELAALVQGGKPVTARVDIDSKFGEEKWQVMVEAFIKGTEKDNEDILVTGHLQEEKYSANDDSSGCASVLEIARAFKKLIDDGRIRRPRRSLRFWWVTEISSQRQYFADNPQAHNSMMANINQDMVGANQSQGVMRVQNMTRVPFSRFHFLNDVSERILEFVVETNQSNLAMIQAGTPAPYPKPIIASLGTRQRYNAKVIPFHNNTDHMTFNEAPIGVPGITFTNWPDNYIHSTDDDLWNIDRTQLQRNAFTVGAIAYVMANAGKESFESISAEVGGRSLRRLGEDYGLALRWLSESKDHYYRGVHQIDQAVKRELLNVRSLQQIASGGENEKRIQLLAQAIEGSGRQFKTFLTEHHQALYGAPGSEELESAETELKGLVPGISAGPEEFLTGRSRLPRLRGLHGLMAFEVLCFVDGQRSGLDIYRAVAAEARRGGAHYYGVVEPDNVLKFLKGAQEAGLVTF